MITNEEMTAYYNEVLKLSEQIRFSGTSGERDAVAYIAERFREADLDVTIDEFRFIGWRLLEEPRLTIEGPEKIDCPCTAYVYSSSTPAGGLRGRLQFLGYRPLADLTKFRPFERNNWLWRQFGIMDEIGRCQAYIVVRDYPKASPSACWGVCQLPFNIPTVLVGELDGSRIASWVSAGLDVTAHLDYKTCLDSEARSYNVVGTKKAEGWRKSDPFIIVCAHHDSQYNTVGAVDNASGVAGLFHLSRRLRDKSMARTIKFVSYGGEEIGLLGAKYMVTSLKASGELNKVACVVNLDMIACNEPNWIHVSSHDFVSEIIREVTSRYQIASKYGAIELVAPPWPTGDQDPFYEEGIPVINFTWKGYQYPYVHLPSDTPDKVNLEVARDTLEMAELALELVAEAVADIEKSGRAIS